MDRHHPYGRRLARANQPRSGSFDRRRSTWMVGPDAITGSDGSALSAEKATVCSFRHLSVLSGRAGRLIFTL
jgi:hypothetical protein